MSKCTVACITLFLHFFRTATLWIRLFSYCSFRCKSTYALLLFMRVLFPADMRLRYCAAVVRRACLVLKVFRVVYYGFTALWRTPLSTLLGLLLILLSTWPGLSTPTAFAPCTHSYHKACYKCLSFIRRIVIDRFHIIVCPSKCIFCSPRC